MHASIVSFNVYTETQTKKIKLFFGHNCILKHAKRSLPSKKTIEFGHYIYLIRMKILLERWRLTSIPD